MGYFNLLPDILYQSPLSHKISSGDFIAIKNIFRSAKLFDYLSDNATLFNKYVIEDGERPDTIAQKLYGSSTYDYVIILIAGITNIAKYGSEVAMNEVHHYETYEIKDSNGHQILPPNLIVDKDFKLDGSSLRYPANRFTLISQVGNTQLDDKNEYTITDNIARPVTNFEYEINENEKLRKIDVLRSNYLQIFVNDIKDILSYDKSSNYITRSLAQTRVTDLTI